MPLLGAEERKPEKNKKIEKPMFNALHEAAETVPSVWEPPTDAPLPETALPEIPVVDISHYKAQSTSAMLDSAASVLISALPDYIVLALERAADAGHITMWQQVLGLVVMTFNSGTIVSPVIDPAWLTDAPMLAKETVCETCGTSFKPKARGQKYCSNECGIGPAQATFKLHIANAR